VRDLIGQLIGELNNSHTYVWGGDPGFRVSQVSVGLLGADVKREGSAYRVERIYRGDPADQVVAPLRAPGADLKEGDYILAVNHVSFEAGRPFYSYFENLAGRSVVLTVNSRNAKEGSRDVVVETVGSEGELRYADWVRGNREYVARKTDGKIGYLHIPDMDRRGLIEFNTWFYPQLDRQGLVVDARWNGGGNVSQMIVERLRRRVVSFDRSRGGGIESYPYKVVNGPFVVMTNEFAGSDGDIFPAAIQREKLAPVIGKRSWGGVVGIRGDKLLVDGGTVTEPEYAWWEAQGGWTIENRGVDPDIVVENLPQDVAKGVDAQLDRAIEEVLRLQRERPTVVPEFGPPRRRTREAFQGELGGSK
jgi:tricorn protease